ncbi:hypothetical protein CERZMDRAFT_99874 [Cercospora zeae-maydis SCOH1-5]|uniref:Acyl-CoA thioesterase II n=1 Tax=Cercospora zeae-maydis SCOH1-5 TaxID=717836 RepID=A0A6A6F8U9_9PEZI|nr:hypothetical protein CERZMDRAFT_99874 [Cercospora zeae-maydis SCOH1-5]
MPTKNAGSQSLSAHEVNVTPIVDVLTLVPGQERDVYHGLKAQLWTPIWARGIYGGTLMSQALVAAMQTVPQDLNVHSMHCFFDHAADDKDDIVYHVERTSDGRSFAARMVRASQRAKTVFHCRVNFMRKSRTGDKLVHSSPMPENDRPPPDVVIIDSITQAGNTSESRPCDCVRCPLDPPSIAPHDRKLRHWMRARGVIKEALRGDAQSSAQRLHTASLAFMTDLYFISTVYRAHGARRFTSTAFAHSLSETVASGSQERLDAAQQFIRLAGQEERSELSDSRGADREIGMMATLNHAIFFHCTEFRADEWMLAEMDTPWAGEERGLTMQRIWGMDGQLLATCVQEGVVRLRQRRPARSSKMA